MTGRVCDPVLGRFLSADPFIHDVTNSQDLNRYSYVHNNPLSLTDMNGYGFFKSIGKFFKKFWKPLLAIIVAIVAIHLGPLLFGEAAGTALVGAESTLTFGQSAIISGISGGLSNVVLTGRPKAFLTGFGQAFATFGVGHGIFKGGTAFGSAKWAGKAVAHGVVGGAFAEIRGGSFKSGFLAAGFSSAVAPLAPSGNIWAGAAFSAAAGGVGSVLGGGKFADGAVTGAFTYLFNEAWDGISNDTIAQKRAEAIAEVSAYLESADLSMGAKESGIVAILDLKTGEIRYLTGADAGTGTSSRFDYKFTVRAGEMVLVIGHSHPASDASTAIDRQREDRISEGIRNNGDDEGLVGLASGRDPTGQGATLVIITPTGNIRAYPGGG